MKNILLILTLLIGITVDAQTCENSKIYPNPSASNIITITNDDLITRIEIFDLMGKSILIKEYNDYSINLILDSSFKTGTYIIKINNECTRKFISKGIDSTYDNINLNTKSKYVKGYRRKNGTYVKGYYRK